MILVLYWFINMYFQLNLCMTFVCICLHIIEKDVHPQRHAKRTIRIDNSQFREKLIEILRMPYNQREYEELLHKITDRKPMQRHRDLRGRIKVYDSSLLGKSYLDYYSGKLNMDFTSYICLWICNISFFN